MEPDYALARQREISVGIDSKQYRSVTLENDEKKIAADVISNVANFVMNQVNDYDARRALSQLKAMPLCLEQCELVNKLIEDHPGIMVVENEVNYHEESGLYKFCWERTLNINSSDTLALIGEEGIAALRQQGKVSLELLTITNTANNALKNVIAEFKRPRPAPVRRTYTPAPTYSTPLVYNPPKKERSCNCTIV